MNLPVTATLASISGLIIIALTFNVQILRYRFKVAVGEIKEEIYARRNGALTNFTANTLIVLVLSTLAEYAGVSRKLLFIIAVFYLLARLCHIYSLYSYEVKHNSYIFRGIGMFGTYLVIITLAVINLYISFPYLVNIFS